MKKLGIILCLLALSTWAHAITRDSLVNYSKSLNGLKKESLKTAVYKLLNKNVSMLAYGSGKDKTWWGFYYTDRNTKTNECINRYSAKKFYFGSYNTGEAISGMNIEHSFPKSWWGGSNNNAYKDLFNLYPSDSQANSSKSNYPMGLVTNVSSEEPGYDKVGTGTIDGVPGTRCWEPGDQYKGDFSRAYMYMATTYQNLTWQGKEGLQQLETGAWPTLKSWAYTLYLKWIKDDPVDELEINRNNAVYAKQGNRNLFVDYPYLAEYIWGDSIDVPFNPSTSITTAVDDERYIQHGVDFIAQPKFSPEGGTYYEEQLVSITCATPGVTILYTTDGSNPIVNGVTYSSPITVKESTTIKAVAVKDGKTSEVATAAYVIEEVSTDFAETFDLCDGTGGNDGLFSGSVASGAFKPDNEGWVATSSFGAKQCARFGSSKKAGIVTTPTFFLEGEATLTFKAVPWGNDGTNLKLTVNGNAELSQTQLAMKTGEWTSYSLTLTGNGSVSITFTPDLRFFLDDIFVMTEKEDWLIGDVNKDNLITVIDVTLLVDIILGNVADSIDMYNLDAADVNNDGVLSVTDVTEIVNIILGNQNPN